MKKNNYIIIFLCFLFLSIPSVKASKTAVTLSNCVDGDTAKFVLKNKEIAARFLAIDTPETKHPTKGEEPWGKEASEFTCNSLKTAEKIEIEYDSNSSKTDKYDRHLVWVWIDDYLLQDLIISKGYAEVAYLYDDYKYTSLLQDHQAIARSKKIGIWNEESNQTPINYWYVILLITFIIIVYIFGSKQTKKKIKNKLKSKLKKEFQRHL